MELILAVDDNLDILQLLQDYVLEPLGYRVMTATDSQVGLDIALQYQPDLILLDMNMSPMTGLETLAALRAANCEAPVILITAEGSELIAVTAFRMGVYDYVTKPFDIERVQKIVGKALYETQLERERAELSRSLIMAEAARQTVTTLAHHLNNQLMVAEGGLHLVKESLLNNPVLPNHDRLLRIVETSQFSLMHIEAVIRALGKINKLKLTKYNDHTQMLDIKTAINLELDYTLQQNQLQSMSQESRPRSILEDHPHEKPASY